MPDEDKNTLVIGNPDGPLRKILRSEAVKQQLDAAIRLFFLEDDFVSAITLAGAAERVLSDMQPRDGLLGVDAFSIRSLCNLYIEDNYSKQAADAFRKPYDLFRHADKSPQETFIINEDYVDFYIFISVMAFQFLFEKLSPSMRVFTSYTFMRKPQWLKPNSEMHKIVTTSKYDLRKVSKSRFYELAICHDSTGN